MTGESRPDPDAVLARVRAEEGGAAKGRLKVFFGYSAGVGKTYAMLEAARTLEIKREDVLVGYVEPHGRQETEALLLGLEILPFKEIEYRGIRLREFDLDEALRRKPRLVLVDELAHTNAEGSRHPKRWQDVLELLDAGIDVYTTVNVQHIESLNDVVGKITGIVVRETVPDTVIDRADEIEVVDLPPGELLERFREGKVYLPDQARRAADRFFKKETLVALRELALRKAAEHVNRQVELGRRGLAARPIWATRERLMVAVGPAPSSAKLVRAARRMASQLQCPWYAVAVEPTTRPPASGAAGAGVEANLRLAERLGAETATVQGDRVSQALIAFAHDRDVTRLVIGKTARSRWWRLTRGDIVDEIIRYSGDVDVLVMRGDEEPGTATSGQRSMRPRTSAEGHANAGPRPIDIALTTGLLAGATLAGLALRWLGATESSIVMCYLLAVAVVAYAAGRAASLAAAVLAILLFNFFFTIPYYSLAFEDPGHAVTFLVMLAIGLAISGLVGRVRRQAAAATGRADAGEVVSRHSRRLSAAAGAGQVAAELLRALEDDLHLQAAILLADPHGSGFGECLGRATLVEDPRERGVAAWSLERAQEAGKGTDTLPDAAGWYVPLVGGESACLGVVAVRAAPSHEVNRERRRLARSVVAVTAQALERERLAGRITETALEARTERLRSDLLAAVSHDLRTPLAAISGVASTLLESRGSTLSPADRDLLRDAAVEAQRLARLVENLLQLGRLDEGKITPHADWHPVDEIAATAIREVSRTADTSRIRVALPEATLLVWADDSILTQALINLFENALRYAPAGPVTFTGSRTASGVRLEVADAGPGFPPGDPARLFRRFTRGESDAVRTSRGSGLGLAICRAVAEAHGGSITAANLSGAGALVTLDLPDPPGLVRPSVDEEANEQAAGQPLAGPT